MTVPTRTHIRKPVSVMKTYRLILVVFGIFCCWCCSRWFNRLTPRNGPTWRGVDEVRGNLPDFSSLKTVGLEKEQRNGKGESTASMSSTRVERPLNHTAVTDVKSMFQEIGKRHAYIVLLYLNLGYLNMTKSWICNVECMGILPQTVIICSDSQTYWSLKKWKPNLNVVLQHFGSSGALTWGEESYFDFLLFRAKSVDSVLQGGHSVFLVEADTLWYRNPVVLFEQYRNNDLILVANVYTEEEKQRRALPALAYLNATSNTKTLWSKLVAMCDEQLKDFKQGRRGNAGNSDMGALNELIRSEPVKLQWLPEDKFVGGKWYKTSTNSEEVAKSLIVIHNNFVKGNDAKEKRAKLWGHWFLSDDATQCIGEPCSYIPLSRPKLA